jgi:transposase
LQFGGLPEPAGIGAEDDRQAEAGPTGYVLYWQLTQLGVACEVIAPPLIPTKAGDRVKTDRRDAERLARCHRAGELTAVWVPDAKHEALRDLLRAREAAKQDQLRHRHRLGKFLLRHGKRPIDAGKPWTGKYLRQLMGYSGLGLPASARGQRPPAQKTKIADAER